MSIQGEKTYSRCNECNVLLWISVVCLLVCFIFCKFISDFFFLFFFSFLFSFCFLFFFSPLLYTGGASDVPFSGNYDSTGTTYDGEAGTLFCPQQACRAGQCTGNWPASECSAANVIRTAKDMPNTRVMGIFVNVGGSGAGSGPKTLYNVSSCDDYAFDDATKTSKCPYFTNAGDFNELKAALSTLMATLSAEVKVTQKVVVEQRQVEESVTDEIREEVYTCEKDTNILLLVLLLLPLFIWLMALPTYIITKAVCCPDYGYDDEIIDDDDGVDKCEHGIPR